MLKKKNAFAMSRDPELLQERFYSQTPQKDHVNITQFFDLIGI